MRIINFILPLLFLLNISLTFSQDEEPGKTDEDGKKQGYWIIKGKHQPEKNYPPECIIKEGNYKDSRKNGEWKFYYVNGNLRSHMFFINNKVSGKGLKYYENGTIKESFTFKMGRMVDTNIRYFENSCISKQVFYNQIGKPEKIILYSPDSCNYPIDTVFTKTPPKKVYDNCFGLYPKPSRFEPSDMILFLPLNDTLELNTYQILKASSFNYKRKAEDVVDIPRTILSRLSEEALSFKAYLVFIDIKNKQYEYYIVK